MKTKESEREISPTFSFFNGMVGLRRRKLRNRLGASLMTNEPTLTESQNPDKTGDRFANAELVPSSDKHHTVIGSMLQKGHSVS